MLPFFNPKPLLLSLFLLLWLQTGWGQSRTFASDTIAGIMFYNVENLFDTKNEPGKQDDDFTPDGVRRWTYGRMHEKFTNISRVILNAGGWNLPVLVGLCEVENSWVLNTMLRETGLDKLNYRVIHYDSPDMRGIDVAMLYRRDRFQVHESRAVPVDFGPNERPTRDILYVKGVLDLTDTLHVLVNHWPSRFGGAAVTQWKRQHAARLVRQFSDSIFQVNPQALLIIMGDFNEPHKSDVFLKDLEVGFLDDDVWLISPALNLPAGVGTLKYQHAWEVFDQIIVSRSFFNGSSSIYMIQPDMKIISLPFLLERDEQMGGMKPFRTYVGFRYAGGYSDHLPVWIDLIVKSQ